MVNTYFLNDSSLIKLTYNRLRNYVNDINNYSNLNWASHIKQILNEIGMSNVWNNQYNLNTSNLSSIKQRIIDIYQQTWHNSINQSQKLDSYKQYKKHHLHGKLPQPFNYQYISNFISKISIILSWFIDWKWKTPKHTKSHYNLSTL